MVIRVAINGYGRIGRNILRALFENQNKYSHNIQIVAINDLADPVSIAHLTQYDSSYGRFEFSVVADNDYLVINGEKSNKIKLLSEKNPIKLPWKRLNIDLVLECTGLFASKSMAAIHLVAGAKKVLISAPAGTEIKTVVYGINHKILTKKDLIVSNASCTTNCLAPLAWVLHKNFKVIKGLMTTIHSYTNDQVLADVYHPDLRRARSATTSIIPTNTGAASALGLVIPALKNKLDGFAIRVPTASVSVLDLTVMVQHQTTVDKVNHILKLAALDFPEIIAINEVPLVSIDFKHNDASSILDLTQTKVLGNLIKVLSWYDNEWAFANRMLDTAFFMGGL